MPRITAALAMVATVAFCVGFNITQYPAVWDMVATSINSAPPPVAKPNHYRSDTAGFAATKENSAGEKAGPASVSLATRSSSAAQLIPEPAAGQKPIAVLGGSDASPAKRNDKPAAAHAKANNKPDDKDRPTTLGENKKSEKKPSVSQADEKLAAKPPANREKASGKPAEPGSAERKPPRSDHPGDKVNGDKPATSGRENSHDNNSADSRKPSPEKHSPAESTVGKPSTAIGGDRLADARATIGNDFHRAEGNQGGEAPKKKKKPGPKVDAKNDTLLASAGREPDAAYELVGPLVPVTRPIGWNGSSRLSGGQESVRDTTGPELTLPAATPAAAYRLPPVNFSSFRYTTDDLRRSGPAAYPTTGVQGIGFSQGANTNNAPQVINAKPTR